MTRIVLMILMTFFLGNCADSNFTQSDAKTSSENAGRVEQNQNPESLGKDIDKTEPELIEEETTHFIESTEKICLAAINGEPTEVITVSQDNFDFSQLSPDAVILINVTGQTNIDLSKEDIAKLGGVCVASRGQAMVQIDFSTVVTTMFFYARGGSNTTMNFGESGNLKQLATNISGDTHLSIEGSLVDCDTLSPEEGGSSAVECNGSPL